MTQKKSTNEVDHDIDNTQRLDQWLCYARFFKTRSLAAKIIKSKGVRIDGDLKKRASANVKIDQTLTFVAGERVRVIKIRALATRRGPASEAALLYEDMSPPPAPRQPKPQHDPGMGRPTKKQRRQIQKLQGK